MLAALDLARVAGVAVGGRIDLPPWVDRLELPAEYERGLSMLWEYVAILVTERGVRIVIVEKAERYLGPKRTADTFFRLASYGAIARTAAYRHGAQTYDVSKQTWRKHFLGDGNLKTDEAHRAAKARCRQLGYRFMDDVNVAEACGIWDWGMATYCSKTNPARLAV